MFGVIQDDRQTFMVSNEVEISAPPIQVRRVNLEMHCWIDRLSLSMNEVLIRPLRTAAFNRSR
jgi:hypothetical protein